VGRRVVGEVEASLKRRRGKVIVMRDCHWGSRLWEAA